MKGSFFYKDKSGVRLGPSVLDTMKIMWDFKEIDENTEVFAEGLMEGFQPVIKVPELHRAPATGSLLEAAKTELRAKEATIEHMSAPGKGGSGSNPLATPRAAVPSAARGAKSPWTPPPPRPTGDLTESEYDEDDDYQVPASGQEAANGVVESTNPIYAGKAPAGRPGFSPTYSPPAGSRSRRGPSPTRSGRAGPQL